VAAVFPSPSTTPSAGTYGHDPCPAIHALHDGVARIKETLDNGVQAMINDHRTELSQVKKERKCADKKVDLPPEKWTPGHAA
jgi:hypothetical protein